MKTVAQVKGKRKKKKTLGSVKVLTEEAYQDLDVEAKAEFIKALIPLGLMRVATMLEEEVESLVGPRYTRGRGQAVS